MKLETLEDLLTVDVDKLKSPEKTRLLTRIKQLIKAEGKADAKADSEAEKFPYEAVSVVSNKLVHLAFDLETKKARVVDTEVDSRDTRGRNYMAGAAALKKVQEMVKTQKLEVSKND